MRERLIELINTDVECTKDGHGDCSMCEYKYADDKCARFYSEIIADYLLDNGVIVLPCKVGDVVYTNIKGIGLQNSFRVNSVDLLGFSNGIYSWTWYQLGKSVFLTLEDAQNALKGGAE